MDVLKIHKRSGIKDDEFDGVQYTVLSDLFIHYPAMNEKINQIAMVTSYTFQTLVDSVGREAEHGWNIWASQKFLHPFASISTVVDPGTFVNQPRQVLILALPYPLPPHALSLPTPSLTHHLYPILPNHCTSLQFDELLKKADLPSDVAHYHHTFLRLRDSAALSQSDRLFKQWKPVVTPVLHAEVPIYTVDCTTYQHILSTNCLSTHDLINISYHHTSQPDHSTSLTAHPIDHHLHLPIIQPSQPASPPSQPTISTLSTRPLRPLHPLNPPSPPPPPSLSQPPSPPALSTLSTRPIYPLNPIRYLAIARSLQKLLTSSCKNGSSGN